MLDEILEGLLLPPLVSIIHQYLPRFQCRARFWLNGKFSLETTQNQLVLRGSYDTIPLDKNSSHFFPTGKLTVDFGEFDARLWNEHGCNLAHALAHYDFTLFKVMCTVSSIEYDIPIVSWIPS